MELTNSESVSIRYLRAISTIFIVVCHYLQSYNNKWCYIFNIGVQLFFIMSGYLFGYQHVNGGGWFYKRWRKLYVPYLIFVGIIVCCLHFLNIQKISYDDVIKFLFLCQGFLGSELKGLGHLWFITAIFVCYWITPFLQYITTRKNGNFYSGILLLVMGLFSCVLFLGFNTDFSWEYSWFFNYICGYLLAKSLMKYRISYLICCVIFFITTLFSIVWVDFISGTSINIAFHSFGAQIIFLLFVFCSKLFEFKTVIQPIGIIEKYSLYIYLVHYPFTRSPWSFVGKTSNILLDVFLTIIVIIFATVILYHISKFAGKIVDKMIP